MLAVMVMSVIRLFAAGPPLSLPLLIGAPALLALGFAALWAISPRRDDVHAVAGTAPWNVVPDALRRAANNLARSLRRPVGRGVATRGELVLLGIILLLFGVVVVRLIASRAIFGFDESIYALTSRWWVAGTPNTGWSSHRSPGISLLGIAALPFGTAEASFRAIGLAFGLGALVACWRLGRELGGPAAGLLAALAVATIPDFQLNSAAFLTDVPSAALVLLLMLLAWRRFAFDPGGSRTDRALLLLAPLAAATFYLRYGSAVPIAFVGVATVVLWPRRILARWRAAVATAGLLIALLVPHMIFAMSFGSPWAIALSARNLAAPDYPGQALQVYVGQLLSTVAAPIAGGVAIVGVVAAAWHAATTRRVDRRLKAYLFLLVPALGAGLLLGIVALAQTRYVYVPVMLLVVAGAIAIAVAWQRLPGVPRAGSAVLAFVIAAIVLLNVGGTMVVGQEIHARDERDVILAAERIRADALSRSPGSAPRCSVLTYRVPEVTWYSGCAVFHYGYPAQPGREALLSGPNRYLMLMEETTIRQPQGSMLEGYLGLVEPEPIAVIHDVSSGSIAARIYRFRIPTG